MLKHFFKINAPFSKLVTLDELEKHFDRSSSVESVLFEPPEVVASANSLFRRRNFTNVSFSKTKFERVTFTECYFVDCLFIGTQFVHSDFHKCTFENCNTHKISFEACYIDPKSFQLDRRYKESHSNVGVWLFHELYKNSKNLHQPVFSSEAEILFKQWKRALRIFEYGGAKKANMVRYRDSLSFLAYLGKDWLYDTTVGYGHRSLRFFLLSALGLFIVAGVIHIFWPAWGLLINAQLVPRGSYLTSIYYTTVVTTTLGFGDITPTTEMGRLVAIVLSISGVVWFSLLAAVLVKRFIR